MRSSIVFLALASTCSFLLPITASSQTLSKDVPAALVGTTVTPVFEVALSAEAGPKSFVNDQATSTPVKTQVSSDGKLAFRVEKGIFLSKDADSHKSFAPKTQFKIAKVKINVDDIELIMAPASGGDFADVRLMLPSVLFKMTDEVLSEINQMITKGTADTRVKPPDLTKYLVDFPMDTKVLTPIGLNTLTKGDVTITVSPNVTPAKPKFEEHLEPFHPTLKEAMHIRCGDAQVSLSTSYKYFNKTYTASSVGQRKLGESDAVIEVLNNGEHTIKGSEIPLKWKVGGVFARLTGFINVDTLGAIPVPLESFGKDVTSGDTKKLGVLAIPSAGEIVSIILYDVPTKMDAAGKPTVKQNFEFKFKVGIQHDIVKAVPPAPEIVCKT